MARLSPHTPLRALGQQWRQGRHDCEWARQLIAAAQAQEPQSAKPQQTSLGTEATDKHLHPCPCCGGRMIIIETFEAGCTPRHRPTASAIAIRVDTS
jgi:hypothetical protein